MNENQEFKSGYVAILGKPNAGKSTLLNALLGEKLAAVSDKPQTTRDRVAGILTAASYQIVFLDTPGVIVPKDRFNEVLVWRAAESLQDADLIYYLVDVSDTDPPNERLLEILDKRGNTQLFIVVNKVDTLPAGVPPQLPPAVRELAANRIFYVSALLKHGLEELLVATVAELPPGPMFFDAELLTDRDERFFAAEAVREKLFLYTDEEVPYSTHTEVETFEERPGKDFIRVVIYVERESQKPIVIGAKGQNLKRIGMEARRDIEALTGRPAYLELWVKVRKNWRKNEFDLQAFGYKVLSRKRQRSRRSK